MAKPSIGELKDEIKHRDRRIEELRQEIDEQRDLIRRMEEKVEDGINTIERWKELDMAMNENGDWDWQPFWDKHITLVDNWNKLVRDWNKLVPLLNDWMSYRIRPVGRPLAATEAQVSAVLKLRKQGVSLRGIVDETSLGLNTVRTIVGKKNGTDRTSKREYQRIEIDRQQLAAWKRQRRTGDVLPRQAQRVVEDGRALIKEAKGLARKR